MTIRKPSIDKTPIRPAPIAPAIGASSWALVMCAPRRESEAIISLTRNGWPAWSPMLTQWVTHANVMRRRHAPLFPRYIFVGLSGEGRVSIRQCDYITAIFGDKDRPFVAPSGMVRSLSNRQAAGEFDQTREAMQPEARIAAFIPEIGKRVRYKTGPFSTIEGSIAAMTPGARIRVLLDGMQIPVDAPLDAFEEVCKASMVS